MKHIKIYINEKLHITTKSHSYSCQPKTKEELQKIIIQRIESDGPECNLNDIGVSNITDMSWLFNANKDWNSGNEIFKNFNGDISCWDVSNVEDMEGMFNWCEKFNCDISDWDVSKVKNMYYMFNCCENFNRNISQWDVSDVKSMEGMFEYCTNFRQNLDSWNVSNVKNMYNAFNECPTKPKWYK